MRRAQLRRGLTIKSKDISRDIALAAFKTYAVKATS